MVQELNEIHDLKSLRPFNVFTVDSYQGEENDIILLSLVRSNSSNSVGFLESRNRLVVALSRARRGLYLFGNTATLSIAESTEDVQGREPLWYPLIGEMLRQHRADIDGGLPVTCSKHNNTTRLYDHRHFDYVLAGGCSQKCGGTLPCGHSCMFDCHPAEHEQIPCKSACVRVLTCDHKCSRNCGQKCFCDACGLYDGQSHVPDYANEEHDFFGSIDRLGTDWGGIASYSSMDESTSDALRARHVNFVPVTSGTFETPGCRPLRDPTAGRANSGLLGFSDSHLSPPTRGLSQLASNKPRSGWVQSRQNDFSSQTAVIKRGVDASHLSRTGPEAWKNWDAKKADAELAEKYRLEEATAPKIDRTQLVFKETYIPTTLNHSGERVRASSGPHRRLVPRSDAGFPSLDTVLENSPNPHSGAECNHSKKNNKLRGDFDLLLSLTEVSEAAKKNESKVSKALIEATGDLSSLSINETLPSTFGEHLESTTGGADQGLQSNKQEHLSNRGQGYTFGVASSLRGSRIPSRSSRGHDSRQVGGWRRGFDPPRGLRSSRGGDYSRGVISTRSRGVSRSSTSFRGRGSTGGPARGHGHSRGGQQPSEQVQPQPVGELLGSEDDFLGSAPDTSASAVEEFVDLYGASPPRSRTRTYSSAWVVEQSTPDETTQSTTPDPHVSTNSDEEKGKLINFD